MADIMGISVKVAGTSLFSFELNPGDKIVVKKYVARASRLSTSGAKYRTDAYMLYRGITKVGKLSEASLKKLGGSVPDECIVTKVDAEKKILMVCFRST
ncbi:MAG: hypothetical protein K9M08_17800 [Pirellula sp.]|nr:hypothetical protein [Pirellula sp.]